MISEKLAVSLSIIAIFCFLETSFASGLHFGIIDAIEDKIDELREEREENNDVIPGPDGPSGADNDSAFRSLTVHPHSSDIVLMGTERNGFVFSSDGGRTWSRKRRGLEYSDGLYPEIWDIAFDPLDPSNVYAATLDSPGAGSATTCECHGHGATSDTSASGWCSGRLTANPSSQPAKTTASAFLF